MAATHSLLCCEDYRLCHKFMLGVKEHVRRAWRYRMRGAGDEGGNILLVRQRQ